MTQPLVQLIEEIDAQDTDEQMSSFLRVFQDEVGVPVAATVAGVAVEPPASTRRGAYGAW